MSDQPLISIITINYNDKVGLDRTIKSVTEQTYKNFEYLVIDGNSNDGSKDVIEKYKNEITYWVSEPDSGIYNAMNKGIRKATGKYLLFINSGDELCNTNVLEENYSSVNTEDLIYFDLEQIFEDRTNIHNFPSKLDYNTFLTGTIGHPTTFIKKDLFNRIGLYDESLKIVADWKFFSLAVIKYGCTSRKVNAVLSKFYMDGISSTDSCFTNNERDQVIKEHFSEYVRLNKLEIFVADMKKSRLIKILNRFGFLNSIEEV